MKTLNLILATVAISFTTSIAHAADSNWLQGLWTSEGRVTYAPALNVYAQNFYEVTETEFRWTESIGRHSDTRVFEYELEDDGSIFLYGEEFSMQGSVANKGNVVELCFSDNCYMLNAIQSIPEFEKGMIKTPQGGIAWDWKFKDHEKSYEFGHTPYPTEFRNTLPHGYAFNFLVGETHFIGIYIAALVGEDELDPASYVGSLNLYVNVDGVGEPLAKSKEAFVLEPGKNIRIEANYKGALLSLDFRVTDGRF